MSLLCAVAFSVLHTTQAEPGPPGPPGVNIMANSQRWQLLEKAVQEKMKEALQQKKEMKDALLEASFQSYQGDKIADVARWSQERK